MISGIWIFMNGDRGRACIAAFAKASHPISTIVVPPAKSEEYQQLARQFSASLECPRDVNAPEFVEHYKAAKPFIGVVAGFSTIFRRPLFDTPQYGTINLHAGRVPKYRGGSPLNWQIINGEAEIGLSILRMTEGIDDGPLIASTNIPLEPQDDIATIHAKANDGFATMLCRIFDQNAASGSFLAGVPQDESFARYWLQRSDADGVINWTWPAARVHNFVRALTKPYPGSRTKDIRIWKTEIPAMTISGPPGRVAFIQGRGPYVCCADQAILVTDYSDPSNILRHGAALDV